MEIRGDDRDLLICIARRISELRGSPWDPPGVRDRDSGGRLRVQISLAKRNLVEHKLAQLLGRPLDGSGRMRCHRALNRLSASGLVELIHAYEKATHIRLTAKGKKTAAALAVKK